MTLTRRGMGVIGMKVYAAGMLVQHGGTAGLTSAEAMSYVLESEWSIDCGHWLFDPVRRSMTTHTMLGRFKRFDEARMRALEKRTANAADFYTSYKRPV